MHSAPAIVATAFLLALVHGITPDEHTRPITFSPGAGSYSGRRGQLTGLIVSLAFTLEHAQASQLSNFARGRLFVTLGLNNWVRLGVGLAMALVGAYVLGFERVLESREGAGHNVTATPLDLAGGKGIGQVAGPESPCFPRRQA